MTPTERPPPADTTTGPGRGAGSARRTRPRGAAPRRGPRAAMQDPGPAEPSMLDVDRAMGEILATPAAAIHRSAAYLWASRAAAGYRVCAERHAVEDGLAFLYLGEHYREAALAHAAMGEAWQPLYAEIDSAMADDRAKAFTAMRRRAAMAGR